LLNWLKNIRAKIRDLNTTVNTYKDETENQTLPIIAHINRAKKFMDKSLFLEARDILTEALAISDKDSLVYRYLGMCEEQLGNLKSAIEMYQKSTQINPQDKTSWHKLGMLQVSIKDYESAENSFENASKINPTNTDIQTGWGMSLLKQKKYNQALEKFTKAIQINRYNFSAMLLAAITEIRLGNYNDAEPKLIFLMKTNPTEGAAYEYANMCTLKENFDDAIKYAKKSVELNPNMLPAYMLLGDVYSLKFDYVNSTKYFTEAENRELTNAMLYTAWGNALLNLYKFEEAKEKFQKALLKDLDSIEAQAGMAICLAETKDFERMHDFITFVEEKNNKNLLIHEAKGLAELAYGNAENAINMFKDILNSNPKQYYNYYRLAKCYEKLGKTDMVKDSYEKIIKFSPNFVQAYVDYARFLIKLEDYKDAQRKLRKAEKLAPNDSEILNLLFYTCYILVKENLCEYNIKEAIDISNRIESFEHPELRAELETLLENLK